MFKPGKNHDGYFDSTKLVAQVTRAINIFEGKVNGLARGLFMFDNAPSHLKRKRGWMHQPNGPHMCNGINPSTGERQSFYFPDDHPCYPGWFKGMEQIIRECGLWPASSLPVKCTGSKRPEGQASCCCRHILYSQLDFALQKPLLQEYVESCGHLCDFYPKYHCELNFIEQYWGAAKLRFCVAGRARTLAEMQSKMLECLDDVPLQQIRRCVIAFFFIPKLKPVCRFANRSAHFISTYCQGLSGAQAAWANKKYHGHGTWCSPPRYGCIGEGICPSVIPSLIACVHTC